MDSVLNYEPDPGEDYYSILGCDPSSSDSQILAEYRVRARECHPDKESGSHHKFQKIQAAKETLLDPEMRPQYDSWRQAGLAISFQNWLALRASVKTGMHWATPTLTGRMLGQEGEDQEREKVRTSAQPYNIQCQ